MSSHATIDTVRRPFFRRGRRRAQGGLAPTHVNPALVACVALATVAVLVAGALLQIVDPTVFPQFVDPASLPRPTPFPTWGPR